MKIITVIGARPQFIKAAIMSKKLSNFCEEIIIHTGQHYDLNMSEIFFDELDIPKPKYNLNIGSGKHGYQTAKMLEAIEEILCKESPNFVLVYGDTNSTLAGALAASKLHIPVIHIEAGLRSFNKKMPEEINRILTDHMSNYLFCPSYASIENLRKENIYDKVFYVGDIMKDAVIYYADIAKNRYSLDKWIHQFSMKNDKIFNIKNGFYLSTIHRAENTDNPEALITIINAFEMLSYPILLPLHPRTKKEFDKLNIPMNNIIIIEPVGYLEMLFLEMECLGIITDSGGIQKESYILRKPCTTLRDQTEWIETVNTGWNCLSKINKNEIVEKVNKMISTDENKYVELYGDGNSVQNIIDILERETRI